MKKGTMSSSRMFNVIFLCIALYGGFMQTAIASSMTFSKVEKKQLVLNSHSFNAHLQSSFTVIGQAENVQRGFTVIHFNASGEYEHKTFDTYSGDEAVAGLIEVLGRMRKNKAVFAVLAHDSAGNGLLKHSEKLSQMGLDKLSTLKGRKAYIMHNFEGKIFESMNDTSVSATLQIPDNISDKQVYFPKVRYEFEPNNNRYIAHAGGEVNNIKSTNSKQALDQNYKKGFRLFELDIIETSDGKLVAAHDWKMWARFTDYAGALPPSHAEFMKHKIYGDYTTLDMKGINDWFTKHPDAILVTDKVNDALAFANVFVDKNRLIMELFSVMAVEEASNNGINAMISQEALMKIPGDKFNFLEINNVKYVAVSRRIIANQTKLLLKLKEQGLKVYVYNVNFDAGKDEKYVQENEIGLVYGMYADKWVFDTNDVKLSK